MKTSTLNTIKKTGALGLIALAAVFSFGGANTAFASDTSGGWGDAGMGYGDTSYSYDEYMPSYSYDDYSPSYSYDDYSPSYSYDDYSPYYSSGGYSSGGYSGGSYSTPSYSYTPSPSYSYVPASRGSSGGGYTYVPTGSAGAPQMQYVYSSNTNANTNTNVATASNTNTITNNPVNVFNPTNNNDARINLVVLGGGTGTNTYVPPATQSLEGYCVISPSTAYVGQSVSFTASATGGNGNYAYYWTGDNGLSASSQSFTGAFSYPGYKTASVTITSNGQSITRTCSVNVQGNQQVLGTQASNVTVIRQPATGNPVSGVFLSQVPATGISFGLKMTLFSVGILMWSAFAAYLMNEKRKKNLVLATGTTPDLASRIDQFKAENMRKKGLIK